MWEQRQQDKKLKAKERRRKQPLPDALPSNTEPDDEGEGGGDLGFNDPFFQHDVAMATAKSGKKAKKSKVSLDEQGKVGGVVSALVNLFRNIRACLHVRKKCVCSSHYVV